MVVILPRIVDHDERRRQVVGIARAILLEYGLEKLTVRRIAEAANLSTAVISHYFEDKRQLMLFIFLDTLEIAEFRFAQAVDSGQSTTTCLLTLLPTDEESRNNWKVWIAFWNMTLTDKEFRQQQVSKTENTLQRIRGLLDRNSHVRSLDEEEKDVEERRIFAVLVGIAIQAIHDPENWSAARQTRVLESEFESSIDTIC